MIRIKSSQTLWNLLKLANALALTGIFRRNASPTIPHRRSFRRDAVNLLTLVLLGHMNRKVKLSHESQREIAIV